MINISGKYTGIFDEGENTTDTVVLEQSGNRVFGISKSQCDGREWGIEGILTEEGTLCAVYSGTNTSGTISLDVDKGNNLNGTWSTIHNGKKYTGKYILKRNYEETIGMTSEEVAEALSNVFRYLDGIELEQYIKEFKGEKLEKLMDKLEDTFKYKDKYSRSLFDCVAEDELVEYLNNRYGLKIREVNVTYYEV